MNKTLLKTLFFGLMISSLNAQIPTGYYDNATGTGYALKTQLYNIIKVHSTIGYAGLWTLYKTGDAWKDNYYDHDQTVLDIYSENPDGPDPYNFTLGVNQCGNYNGEGDCYNREHLIPQSIFNSSNPMYSDAFHIWPTDGKVNGMRSNYPFGRVGSVSWTSQNGSKLGSNDNSGYSQGYIGTVFEPIEEFKGDIARAYFYFATCYEGTDHSDWKPYEMFNYSNVHQFFTDAFKNILLKWHQADPVGPREQAINNAIYAAQNNRNPFIDHPDWVNVIWGYPLATDDFEYQARDFLQIYPTSLSVNQTVHIQSKDLKAQIKKVLVFNLNGILVQSFDNAANQPEVQIPFYQSGIYIIKVLGNDFEVNRKVVVK
ncbi:MAG: endonuclease [Prevotellaceae bacterium]|jgi:endonuclease I|nr:endonuclease [Prevotellaceae bacterium]